MIECENVSVYYGSKQILHDFSMTSKSGNITVILGKNGCGKTTLFRAIGGRLRYTGDLLIEGIQSRSIEPTKRAQIISLMPQMLSVPDITVRELISFGRQPYTGITGILSPNDQEIISAVIEKTGLKALSNQRLRCISGGERQKAYFAMLLSQQTQNLLLDEPMSHLDASYANHLLEFLTEERKNGKTVLAIFHDINRAIQIADQIVVIQDGTTAFQGNCQEFCDSHIPEQIFGLHKYLCYAPGSESAQTSFFL